MDGPGASGEDKPVVGVSTLGDADWSRTQLAQYTLAGTPVAWGEQQRAGTGL